MARRFAPVLWITLLLLGLAGAWFWVAPHRAYDRLMQAVAFGSESGLAEAADLPVLRQSFRDDIRAAVTGRPEFNLRGEDVEEFLTLSVDAVVTPHGLAGLITHTPSPGTADTVVVGPTVSFHYQSLSRVDVRIRAANASESSAMILTFTRTGLAWRLTRVWSEQLLSLQGAR
jgi:hypothetical protein